jgi:predicted DCC family thiol-disulfide oxidoreductase YuxK
MTVPAGEPPVVLFDGVCNFCNASVNWLIDRDRGARLRFAALQSPAGQRLLAGFGQVRPERDPDSVVLVEGAALYDRSTALLRAVRHLPGPWSWLAALRIVPRPLRDAIYRWFAARRYRWFGKSDACRVPTPELRTRFLE